MFDARSSEVGIYKRKLSRKKTRFRSRKKIKFKKIRKKTRSRSRKKNKSQEKGRKEMENANSASFTLP